MATMTAFIKIGGNHPNDQGLVNLTHTMYLSENGVARWTLRKENLYQEEKGETKAISWIPTPENMLQDALLMIGLFVYRDDELIKKAEEVFQKPISQFDVIDSSLGLNLEKLYDKVKVLGKGSKLVINVLDGSSITKQLEVLKDYQMELEVTKTIFNKYYDHWSNQVREEGELPRLDF